MDKNHLTNLLTETLGYRRDWAFSTLQGGDINDVFLLSSGEETLVLKYSDRTDTPGMFEAEARGLNLLRIASSGALVIPDVVGSKVEGNEQILILEYLRKQSPQPGFWSNFGRGLAALHTFSIEETGLDHNNYIATLQQDNTVERSWPRFFAERRIRPMARSAERLLGSSLMLRLGSVCDRMEQLMPNDPVSLLHGDLWYGNYICLGTTAALIDPAVYRGSREMDLAMTRLFGGFSEEFYSAYMEVSPLTEGWEERVDLCNLYPMLVHVNLFGSRYVSQLSHLLDKYD